MVAALAAVVLIGGGFYVSMTPAERAMEQKEVVVEKTSDAMMEKQDGKAMIKEDDAMMEEAPEGAMMSVGSYEAYAPEKLAKATDGDVVLFFRASWCPTCRSLDSDIKKNAGTIPKGVTILDVNYDDSTALKQKYGVTMQHTLVQVAADGTLIAKWTGSSTLADIVSKVK